MMKAKSTGRILLGIWLVAYGVQVILPFNLLSRGYVLAILAVVAGIFLLLDR